MTSAETRLAPEASDGAMSPGVAGAVGAVALAGAVLVPLATYALTLACLGLPHVLAELRYVDGRFGGRLDARWWRGTLLLLGGVVVLRALAFAGVWTGPTRWIAELLLVAALVAWALPVLRRQGAAWAVTGVGALGALLTATWIAPLMTLVALAFLHNLTPVAFLAERLAGPRRRRALAWCGLLFGLVPVALVVTGLPHRALAWGLPGSASLLHVGTLEAHQGVFVPAFLTGPLAVDLFATAAWLQCMHYAVVLGVFPRLGAGDAPRSRLGVPWPRRMGPLLWIAGGASAVFFVLAFRDARAFYGIAAAVHAWVEWPLLLAAPALLARSPLPVPSPSAGG